MLTHLSPGAPTRSPVLDDPDTDSPPRRRWRRSLRATPRSLPRWAGELGLVLALYVVYDTTRGLRRGNLTTADDNGSRVLQWEHSLHIAPEHWLNQLLFHDTWLAVPASFFYASLHFIVTPAVLVWMYRRHPGQYRSARTTLVVATGLALIVFWLIPTTPPRLLPGGTFHDTLASVHQWGWWSSEGSAPRGLGSLTNQLAAMPSLHVGWALWSGWLVARHARRRSVRMIGALYPFLTALVVMGTGNHYFLDAVGGAAVIALGAGLTRLATIIRKPAQRRLPVTMTGAVNLPGLSRPSGSVTAARARVRSG